MKRNIKNVGSIYFLRAYKKFIKNNVDDKLIRAARAAYSSLKVEFDNLKDADIAITNVVVQKPNKKEIKAGFLWSVFHPIVKVNYNLWMRINAKDRYYVCVHEFAHLIDFYYRGKTGHGKKWGELCILMDAKEEVKREHIRLRKLKRLKYKNVKE